MFEAAADIVAKAAAARVELAAAAEASAAAAEAEQAGDDEPAELAERLEARTTAAGAALAARDDAAKRSGAAQTTSSRRSTAPAPSSTTPARRSDPSRSRRSGSPRLDATIRGLGDNRRRISLTNYVLAARLEEVATAATAHLQRMSSGRFSLLHHDERFGNGPAGLGLRVLDAHSGEERETATLSGGEAFYASLALALGLADRGPAGGRRPARSRRCWSTRASAPSMPTRSRTCSVSSTSSVPPAARSDSSATSVRSPSASRHSCG
ncbi:MAG: hypothetical protein PGN13_09090 [Patulibacter minatonensis]